MEEYLRDKAKMIEQKMGHQMLQPHVVVINNIGSDLLSMPTYVVLGPKLYYKVESIIHAVDIVLKSAFVFDLAYPAAARSCWTFVQKVIYGLSSENDVVSNRLQELMSSIGV